jgi:acetolactate synthase-1/2/3 large subunit
MRRLPTAAELVADCLAAEGLRHVFHVPGEETMPLLDAFAARPELAPLAFRHEQGAAFAADVYGRLSGRAAVAMATLGPGATNLLTGIADAYLDRAPLVALTGQAGSERLHKESHQLVDVLGMFAPITKWNARLERIESIPELVRKAVRVAEAEKPGPVHLEFPENRLHMPPESPAAPLPVRRAALPVAAPESVASAAALAAAADRPLLLVGNGVLRGRAEAAVAAIAAALDAPVVTTFMGKGAIDDRDPRSMGAAGLGAADDVVFAAFARADLVVAIGYDLVEWSPARWNRGRAKRIVHIDTEPAEVDGAYLPDAEMVGEIAANTAAIAAAVARRGGGGRTAAAAAEDAELRARILAEAGSAEDGMPIRPQHALRAMRAALPDAAVVVSDVGAHKVWFGRLWPSRAGGASVISNGIAAMGIAVPGAIGAAYARPGAPVVALTGDGGLLMNAQEIETAHRAGLSIGIVVWRDDGYGLIDWKQRAGGLKPEGTAFGNPDLVAWARAYGIRARRVGDPARLVEDLRWVAGGGVRLLDVPIDYAENLLLTERLRG